MQVSVQVSEQLKRLFFPPLNGLGQKSIGIGIWVYFWTLSSTPLIYVAILVPVPVS